MLNCSPELRWEVKAKHLSDHCQKMRNSDYSESFRLDVIQAGIAIWEQKVQQDKEGVRPLYRPRDYNRLERIKEKLDNPSVWYTKGGAMAPIFVQATEGSRLAKIVREVVRRSRLPFTVVEKTGLTINRQLQRSNPFGSQGCGVERCVVCSDEEEDQDMSNCRAEGVLYDVTCRICEEVGEVVVYIGETARNLFLRGGEHAAKLRRRQADSVLWQHQQDKHPGLDPRFKYSVREYYGQDTLGRQVAEGVAIQNFRGGTLLNKKDEWRAPGVVWTRAERMWGRAPPGRD